jgi:hypothetical protein
MVVFFTHPHHFNPVQQVIQDFSVGAYQIGE